jgi:hypothetical protein
MYFMKLVEFMKAPMRKVAEFINDFPLSHLPFYPYPSRTLKMKKTLVLNNKWTEKNEFSSEAISGKVLNLVKRRKTLVNLKTLADQHIY